MTAPLPLRRCADARHVRSFVVLALAGLLAVLTAKPVLHHGRAAALLAAFAAESDAANGAPAVAVERTSFASDGRTVPARLYSPVGVEGAPAIVMVHGVHFRGIEEPRLERFARAVAGAGYVVMTPEVRELSDYRVAPASIETVGAAVRDLRARSRGAQVGLMGMSFGGGIALLTAADPRFASQVAFVVAIGAHDDLGRVSRFFVTNEAVDPAGTKHPMHAHEYGATVAVYARISDFFPSEDVPAARASLRKWLEEDREAARAAAAALSPASRAKVEKLFAADVAAVRDEIMAVLATEDAQRDMRSMSPHGNLAGLRANVFLLHGEGDTVIPATETQWLAADVPPARLRMALVTPAIQHVELHAPSLSDRAALVHFMGEVLADASAMRRTSGRPGATR